MTAEVEPEWQPEKIGVDGDCPNCGDAALARYPVVAVGGWMEVVKCQRCLISVSRKPWHRSGFITLPEFEMEER
jgi:uncharacterized protein (DUF983 family)